MTPWRQVRLGDYCEIFSGYPFKSDRFSSDQTGVPLVKGENVGQGEILWSISKYWPIEESDGLDQFRLLPGDVVLAMDRPWVPAGLKYARITRSDPEAFLVQRVARLRTTQGLEQSLLPYVVGSRDFVAYIQNVGRGVGVPHISSNQIADYVFSVPPHASQRRIADVLTAYDDLIENNRRRMALLEDAARQLYREWFVRLRFPGYEHTRIVDGVPEGWERTAIGDVITLNYGRALKDDDRLEGGVPVYGSSGVVGSHSNALVNGPGIVIGRKGNVGSVFWSDGLFWPIDTVYYVSPEQSSLFLYHCLKLVPFQSSDVAVPGLNRTYAYGMKILMPGRTIRSLFEDLVVPMFSLMSNLRTMNTKLRTARALLLPRLMSGQIAV